MTPSDFAALMLGGAQSALPYIGAGVAAGAVVLAVVFGIRKGAGAVKVVAAGGAKDDFGLEEYIDDYYERED